MKQRGFIKIHPVADGMVLKESDAPRMTEDQHRQAQASVQRLIDKTLRKIHSSSKYRPHQGKQECERRRRQIEAKRQKERAALRKRSNELWVI